MTFWLIQPRDPLIFRDGRPFTADPGARATTLPFPFPSTLAGAARTLSVPEPRRRDFDDDLVKNLLAKSLRGPLLVSLNENGSLKEFYLPAPADALLLKQGGQPEKARRQWLRPVELPAGAHTDLDELPHIVGAAKPRPDKVHPKAPAFWRWDDFETWLKAPTDEETIPGIESWGLRGLPQEYRTHVRIKAATQTADPGGLFVTSGLEFAHAPVKDELPELQKTTEFALLVETDADIAASWGFLGGERRVAQWQKLAKDPFPACPPEVKDSIIKQKSCRLVLLTPAYFEAGFIPAWLREQHNFEIAAAAVPRCQTVSGWDYKARQPKITRRLVPAGSVYFLKNIQDAGKFIMDVWMQNISDGGQNRNDGFGLAALGSWDRDDIPEMEAPRE